MQGRKTGDTFCFSVDLRRIYIVNNNHNLERFSGQFKAGSYLSLGAVLSFRPNHPHLRTEYLYPVAAMNLSMTNDTLRYTVTSTPPYPSIIRHSASFWKQWKVILSPTQISVNTILKLEGLRLPWHRYLIFTSLIRMVELIDETNTLHLFCHPNWQVWCMTIALFSHLSLLNIIRRFLLHNYGTEWNSANLKGNGSWELKCFGMVTITWRMNKDFEHIFTTTDKLFFFSWILLSK